MKVPTNLAGVPSVEVDYFTPPGRKYKVLVRVRFPCPSCGYPISMTAGEHIVDRQDGSVAFRGLNSISCPAHWQAVENGVFLLRHGSPVRKACRTEIEVIQ